MPRFQTVLLIYCDGIFGGDCGLRVKTKKRDEKKGMCETCPELNGKRDVEKPNDGIRFAVGQLISSRLVLQSFRRCFACKIFDFFAMRVKP